MNRRLGRALAGVSAAVASAVLLAACGSSSTSSTPAGNGGHSADPKTATSAADLGGLDALVKAAQKEGQLNVIALPRNWANYGEILDAFAKKYGIMIDSANPDGSSQDEINAVKSLKGQTRGPDVLDLGNAFALTAATSGLLAPYKVQTWSKIPDSLKEADGKWYGDYGGYVSIGCNSAVVNPCPASFADLTKPAYKGKVALNGDPTKAGAAFAAVYAAALANGGSFDNIQPGIDFFGTLKKSGNFIPVGVTSATITKNETPIAVNWDYLNAAVVSQVPTWTTAVPTDGLYANYYDQAISAYAPHPAAARLWEEYLYSAEGQNLFLKGLARPVELTAMTADQTVDAALLAKLPKVDSAVQLPSNAQLDAAKQAVANGWAKATS